VRCSFVFPSCGQFAQQVNFAVFLCFFQVFGQICFSGVSGVVLGAFLGGGFCVFFDLKRLIFESLSSGGAWLNVSGGAFRGLAIWDKIQVRGFAVCTSYTVQKPHGGRRSAGAGWFVIRAGFVCPCQLVAGFGWVSRWLRLQRGHSNKCFEQVFEWVSVHFPVRISDRI
jgi:hypothetical protein